MTTSLLKILTYLRQRLLWVIFLSLSISTLAFFLRWHALNTLFIDHDENTYIEAAIYYAQAIQQRDWLEIIRYRENLEHPSLAKILFGFSISHKSDPANYQPGEIGTGFPIQKSSVRRVILPARKLSAVFGTATVFILSLFSPLSGFFLAIHSQEVRYTSEVYLEALPSLTSLLSMLAYIRFHHLKSKPIPKPHIWNQPYIWMFISSIMLGITIAGKYMYGIVGLAILIHWLGNAVIKKITFKFFILELTGYGLVAIVSFFAVNPILWTDTISRLAWSLNYSFGYAQRPKITEINYPWYRTVLLLVQPSPERIPEIANSFYLVWDVPIAALTFLGLPRLARKHLVILLWLLISLSFLIIWKTKWDHYNMIAVPALCIAAGEGLLTIFELLKSLILHWKAK
jgi:hypothetical protein